MEKGGEAYDDRLYLDSVEIAGAFDDVFTPDATPYTYRAPNISVFVLDSALLSLLSDGHLNVQLNTYAGSFPDSIAIDFARLDIEVAPVPEPSTYLLLGSGLAGLAFIRRRRA